MLYKKYVLEHPDVLNRIPVRLAYYKGEFKSLLSASPLFF